MNLRLQYFSAFLCAFVGVCLLAPVPSAPAQQATHLDPADLYLQGYMLLREGSDFEAKQKFTGAFQKYAAASEIFDSIARSYPDWNPHMVGYRRKSLHASINLIQSRARNEQGITLENGQNPPVPRTQIAPQVPPFPQPPLPPQMPSYPNHPHIDNHPLPLPQEVPPRGHAYATNVTPQPIQPNIVARIPQAPSSAAPLNPGDYTINSATNHIENKFRELRLRIDEVGSERDNLSNELRLKEARLQNAQAQLYEAQQREIALQGEIAQAQGRFTTANGNLSGSSPNPVDREKVSILEAQLSLAKANLEAASRTTADLSSALQTSEREVALLKEERGQLITERNQMATIIGKIQTGGSVDLQRMVALNHTLRRQLEVAQSSAGQIRLDTRDAAEIQTLRQQVASISQELEIARAENNTYRSQITTLTSRLQDVSTELASAAKSGINDPQALEENELLRDVILRQLRQQARRQQAKELVMVELAKLETNSNSLLTQIEELAGAETNLTENELAVLGSSPAGNSTSDPSELHGTLVSTRSPDVPTAPSDPRQAIASKITAASTAFKDADYPNAERLYEEIVTIDQQNPYYLCNLGIIKTRLKKFPEAENCFNRALTFDPFHGQSLLMLGALHFEQQNFDASLTALNKAIEVNPNSASAHQFLGLIANQKGWRDRAEQEFLRAIEIDPTFAAAHFNLSVLYISGEQPSRDLAEKHYTEALSHGAKRDAAMEQHIGG